MAKKKFNLNRLQRFLFPKLHSSYCIIYDLKLDIQFLKNHNVILENTAYDLANEKQELEKLIKILNNQDLNGYLNNIQPMFKAPEYANKKELLGTFKRIYSLTKNLKNGK